ncbi:Mobile element protein [Vibrio cholerae]|nr:Mobile element protein [Vibrio cholerae]
MNQNDYIGKTLKPWPILVDHYNRDLIEASLAHVDDNQVRSAYNRTDYIERRKPMMCWWSEHIEEAAKGTLSVTGTKQLKVI